MPQHVRERLLKGNVEARMEHGDIQVAGRVRKHRNLRFGANGGQALFLECWQVRSRIYLVKRLDDIANHGRLGLHRLIADLLAWEPCTHKSGDGQLREMRWATL